MFSNSSKVTEISKAKTKNREIKNSGDSWQLSFEAQ
jgi:hypothetical protein